MADTSEELTDDAFYLEADVEYSTDSEFTSVTVRDKHALMSDEPAGLPHGAGEDAHPAPMDYLVVALTTCQVSVLSQCFEKARIEEYSIKATGSIDRVVREDVPEEMPGNTRTRVDDVSVSIEVEVPEAETSRAERCPSVYDQGCIWARVSARVSITPPRRRSRRGRWRG